MNLEILIGGAFILLFTVLILAFSYLLRKRTFLKLREIASFSKLRHAIGLAVEDGSRLHISIGHGGLTGLQSAAGLVGLSVLQRVTEIASESDAPPIASSGDASLAILSQDTLRSHRTGSVGHYDPQAGRLTGLTPFSYAAGTIPLIHEEMISANILVGSFGSEVALITDAGERSECFTLGGTDSIPAQAVLYATAQEPLIGEELYASPAYIGAGKVHTACLHAQDVLRWVIVIVILGGGLLRFIGL